MKLQSSIRQTYMEAGEEDIFFPPHIDKLSRKLLLCSSDKKPALVGKLARLMMPAPKT